MTQPLMRYPWEVKILHQPCQSVWTALAESMHGVLVATTIAFCYEQEDYGFLWSVWMDTGSYRLYVRWEWYFLEICISKRFGTIADDNSSLVKALCKELPQNPFDFEWRTSGSTPRA
jgi:hypothetical protein